jgi:catechol 2,3-dioxygenase-like lactoylglutathione lyase family enzyme
MMNISGLHHVTAIAGDPQRNLDFYVRLLGLRLVKRTINFDDPGSYHFYFGDARGTPGTILTFFPWPDAHRGNRGNGEVAATAFAIPPASVGYWLDRLNQNHVAVEREPDRFGEEVIRFSDLDGMQLELIATTPAAAVKAWADSMVPVEHALGGFHSVSAALEGYERTAKLLSDAFGYKMVKEAGNRFRFAASGEEGAGKLIDLLCIPDGRRGSGGAGSVHHIAFRAKDDEEQLAWREKIVEMGFNVSPVMDRSYFHSIYFREPGGILFEIATDPPGFTADEKLEELGNNLRLPRWMEKARAQIEETLPPITLPTKARP